MARKGGIPRSSPDRNPLKANQPPGDFFAPFFTAEFTKIPTEFTKGADGDERPATGKLTSSGGETLWKADKQMSRLRSYATSLEVKMEGGKGATRATLMLEPPYEDAVQLVESRVIRRNAFMTLAWGYLPSGPGAPLITSSDLLQHFIIDDPSIDASGTDITITISGMDLHSYGGLRRQSRVVYPRTAAAAVDLAVNRAVSLARTVFTGTRRGTDDAVMRTVFDTDLKILEHLAGKYKLSVNASFAQQSNVVKTRPLKGETTSVREQNVEDWIFFKQICRENRCDFFTMGDTVYITDPNSIQLQDASYRLVMMQQPRKDTDIPLLRFTTKGLDSMYTDAAATEVQACSGDPDTGMVVNLNYDLTKADDHTFLGDRTKIGREILNGKVLKVSERVRLIPHPKLTAADTGKLLSVAHGKPNRTEHAKRLARMAALQANMDAQATIPGVPTLIPQMIVRVSAGFPTSFDGPYRVITVTHRIDADGYETEMELRRDTSSTTDGVKPKTSSDPPVKASGGKEPVTTTDGA